MNEDGLRRTADVATEAPHRWPYRERLMSGPAGGANAMARGGPVMAAELVGGDEIVILSIKPSLLFVPLSSIGWCMAIAFVALLLAYLARVTWVSVPWSEVNAGLLGAAGVVLRLGWQTLAWWNCSYILTDRRVIAVQGVVGRSVFQSPLRNIQHIAMVMSFRERIFGIGTIAFATAGSAGYVAAWVMVDRPAEVHRQIVQTCDRYGRRGG